MTRTNKHFIIRSNVEVHGVEYAIFHEYRRLLGIGMSKGIAFKLAKLTVEDAMKR